ncbi:Hsp20/alpha crystallin family protein [Candidatus Woesearchaeota archaeon]|nr:Hsp20/alpha crystallin family protein [Candidatus Woesearchaeota archaeon]
MGKQTKKRLPFLEEADINTFVKILKRNIHAVRKAMGQFEEPYSEVTHNFKHILIKIALPAVEKRHLTLKIAGRTVEVIAEQKHHRRHVKTYYRSIELPSTAHTLRASATYAGETLYIKVPQVFTRV